MTRSVGALVHAKCCQPSCGKVSVLPGSTASVMYQVTMQSRRQKGQHSNSDSSSSSISSAMQESGRTVLQAWSAHACHASLLRFLLTEQMATHEVTDCHFGAVTLSACSLLADMCLPAFVPHLACLHAVVFACCCAT